MRPKEKSMLAEEVLKQEKLPRRNRQRDEFKALEQVYRNIMAPDIPAYDVTSVQSAHFDEWIYTEGLGCFLCFTQSVEINARLALAAVEDGGASAAGIENTHLQSHLVDKWTLLGRARTDEDFSDKKVFFPPGSNLKWIINLDVLMRVFDEDPQWLIKPHPVTHDNDVADYGRTFGVTRVLDKMIPAMPILQNCSVVGHTTASEMGMAAMLLGKRAIDFTTYAKESYGRYHSYYVAVRRNRKLPPEKVLDYLAQCPWSGVVPLNTPLDVAADHFAAFKRKTLELRDTYAPIIRRRDPPPQRKRK